MTNAELATWIQNKIGEESLLEIEDDKHVVWAGDSREKLVAIMREAFRLQDEEEGK